MLPNHGHETPGRGRKAAATLAAPTCSGANSTNVDDANQNLRKKLCFEAYTCVLKEIRSEQKSTHHFESVCLLRSRISPLSIHSRHITKATSMTPQDGLQSYTLQRNTLAVSACGPVGSRSLASHQQKTGSGRTSLTSSAQLYNKHCAPSVFE